MLPADDLAITPTNTFLEFGQTVSVHCKENSDQITDGFVKLELVSTIVMGSGTKKFGFSLGFLGFQLPDYITIDGFG